MGDFVKIAVKTALIVTIMAGIVVIFATVQIPTLDFTLLTQGLGLALAVLYHYLPIATVIVPLALVILSLDLAIITFRIGMIAVKWIMKVNE